MELLIRPLRDDADAAAFRALNEEWITHHFVLEDEDRRQLADPVVTYVDPGGDVLIAELDGRRVGCAALLPERDGSWELSKMAVDLELRPGPRAAARPGSRQTAPPAAGRAPDPGRSARPRPSRPSPR